MPFTEEELAYIARLDAAADVALLQQQLPSLRVESLRTLQVQTLSVCNALLAVPPNVPAQLLSGGQSPHATADAAYGPTEARVAF